MEMTGPFAVVGKTGLLAFKICEDEVNAEGGLLGRPRQCVMDFVKKYQARAPAEGVALLGHFLPPFAYSELQILGDAIATTKTLDDDKLAEYLHSHPFHTIVGPRPDGEWTEARPIWVQYHGIKGHDVEQFRGPATVAIRAPA
jgi:branched-chain amino acid transport system substrate-binding protein